MALLAMVAALALSTALAVLAGAAVRRELDDAAAQATGKYLLAVRHALVLVQTRHEAWLQGLDPPVSPDPGVEPPPAWAWQTLPAGQAITGTVALLREMAALPADFPDHMPLGERAHWTILRQGECPGRDCLISAFVYSCHPISALRSSRQATSCLQPSDGREQYDPALLGRVLTATDGYGGHDALGDTGAFVGPLLHLERDLLPISAHRGRIIVAATLGATPYGQFVRHGETRPVHLHNSLTVDGALSTGTGLIWDTAVSVGQACAPERMYATTASNQLAVCTDAVWTLALGRSVQAVHTGLVHDAYVAPPVCPPPAQPFRHVALTSSDVLVSGEALSIHGDVAGTLWGSGYVNHAGSVTVSGAYSGAFQSAPTSSVRISQSATLSAQNRIVITPPGPNARAAVIQGCIDGVTQP